MRVILDVPITVPRRFLGGPFTDRPCGMDSWNIDKFINKNTAIDAVFFIVFFLSQRSGCWAAGAKYLIKSFNDAPVASRIFAMLLVDGHRGWPYLDQRLLLLNVVGSSPLHFAKPEHDIPCSVAKRSMARQTSSCVIFSLPLLVAQVNTIFCLTCTDFIPEIRAKQQVAFPRNE